MHPVRILVPLLGLAVLAVEAAGDPARERAARTITPEDLTRHVRVLASDEFEGRAPATRGEERTVAYLEEALRRAGVGPSPNGSYRQPVELVQKRTRERRFRVEGKGDPLELTHGEEILVGPGRAMGPVDLRSRELVFAGFGITAPELGWDDYAGLDVEGKVVIVFWNDPGAVTGDPEHFEGLAQSFHATPDAKDLAAVRAGAVGILFIHDMATLGVPWETLAGGSGLPKFDLPADAARPVKPVFGGLLREDVARDLLARAGLDLDAEKEKAVETGYRGRPLGLHASVELDVEVERSVSTNVVGMIEGSEAPDEAVLYTAHWDHVGIGTPVEGDSVYNGAVDNATGTAAVLEIAEAYASLPEPPRRSVVFILTTAEEKGLLGGYHYAANPFHPLESTVAVLNLDALFPFGEFDGMTVTGLGSSEVEETLAEAAARYGRALHDDPQPQYGGFFRSDHFPFVRKGVPGIFAVGGPKEVPEGDPVGERFMWYMQSGYHKPQDEVYDWWDVTGIVTDARIFFETGYALARSDHFPNWYEGSAFRPIRDRMRAGM